MKLVSNSSWRKAGQIGLKWLRWEALSFLIWTVLAAAYSIQQVRLSQVWQMEKMTFTSAYIIAVRSYTVWAFLCPFVYWLARRTDFSRSRWLKVAIVHLIGFFTFLAAHAVLRTVIFGAHNPKGGMFPKNWDMVVSFFVVYFNDDIFVYFPIVAVAIGIEYYKRARDREVSESKLQAELARAQLHILKMQLHPHFLFNALHTISSLVSREPRLVKKMIFSLSELLRMAMEHNERAEIALAEELELLDRYLDIERVRFDEKLAVEVTADPESLKALVPPLLLQPLVENSIKHGIGALTHNGRVSVHAARNGFHLRLTIRDNGPGLPAHRMNGSGIGLQNTRARLKQLYGNDFRFFLQNGEEGGALALIEIPFRPAPAAELYAEVAQ